MCHRLFVATLIALLPLISHAQPLADRVPGDALLYIGWQGSEAMPAAFAQSNLKGVLDHSGLAQLFSQAYPQLVQRVSQEDAHAGQVLSQIGSITGPLFRHPTAMVLLAPAANAPMPAPRFALFCQAGNESDALLKQFNGLLAQLPPIGIPASAVKQGDLVLLTINFDQPALALAADASKSIAKSPSFLQSSAQVAREPVAIFYVDAQATLAYLDKGIRQMHPDFVPDWTKAVEMLGLSGLHRIIWTGSFEGANWSEQTFIDAPAPRKGVPAMLDAPPLSDAILHAVPKTATWVGIGQLDLGGLFTAIHDILAQFNPEGAQMMNQALGAGQMALGFNPKTDLLDALGPEWALYNDPTVAGNGPMGLIVVNHLRKADVAQRSLKKLWLALENMVNGQLPPQDKMHIGFEHTQADGVDVYYVALPFVSPSWTIQDDKLFLALYPQLALSAANAAKGPSLVENPDFQSLRQALHGTNANGLLFVDLPKSATEGYQTLLAMSQLGLGFANMAGIQTPPMVIPPLRQLRPYLNPAAEFSWTDEAGYHSLGRTPFPGAQALTAQNNIILGYTALMTSIMLPALNAAKERANRVKCASNLRQIGQGCLLYANDHKGQYPPDLGTLVKEGLNEETFVCPSGDTQVPPDVRGNPDKAAAWVNQHGDYTYLGAGKKENLPADTILAYEKAQDHDRQGMNMLFWDGHVDWYVLPAAEQLIQRQKAADQQLRGDKL